MVFFTDRDLGATFPRILSENGIDTIRHDDHFTEKTNDCDWLLEAGRRNWFAISKDKHIRYRPNERDAAMQAGVGLFIIIGSLPHKTLADNFVATVATIERFVKKNNRPFIAKVHQPSSGANKREGRVELWLSHKEWSN